jgi:hypothetical protein
VTRLSVIGPLGNAFLVPENCHHLILVAGGVGVPPIRFLAQSMLEREGSLDRCVVFVGGRTKDDLVCITEFDLPGFLLDVSTDDGSQGKSGDGDPQPGKGAGCRSGGHDMRMRAAGDAQGGFRNRHKTGYPLPGFHRGHDGLWDGRLPGMCRKSARRRYPLPACLCGRPGVRGAPARVVMVVGVKESNLRLT